MTYARPPLADSPERGAHNSALRETAAAQLDRKRNPVAVGLVMLVPPKHRLPVPLPLRFQKSILLQCPVDGYVMADFWPLELEACCGSPCAFVRHPPNLWVAVARPAREGHAGRVPAESKQLSHIATYVRTEGRHGCAHSGGVPTSVRTQYFSPVPTYGRECGRTYVRTHSRMDVRAHVRT